MMNSIKDNVKFSLRLSRLRRVLNPDRTFMNSARERFLNSLAPQKVPMRQYVFRWGYVLAVVVIAVAGTGGLAVFADFTNVPVTSSLYPLKRASEETRLILTPVRNRPALHTRLAERRVKEIEQTKLSPLIEKLHQDLGNEIDQAIGTPEISVEPTPVKNNPEETNVPIVTHEARDTEKDAKANQRRICKLAKDALRRNLIDLQKARNIEVRCGSDF